MWEERKHGSESENTFTIHTGGTWEERSWRPTLTGASLPRTRKQRKDGDENTDTDGSGMKDLKFNKEERQCH